MSKTEKTVPAATIRGTYSTYEDMKPRSLVEKLGNVVDLKLEDIAQIELGSWGTALKITCEKGVKVSMSQKADGKTVIRLTSFED